MLAIGVRDKGPYKALAIREALAWRVEELGRGAAQMFQQDDMASAILLSRGVVECAAVMARVVEVVAGRAAMKEADLHDALTSMLSGSKSDSDFPQAINVATYLKHLEKRIEGVSRVYDHLSEYAHPNWGGVSLLFSRIDYDQYITYFGKFEGRTDGARMHALNALVGGLEIFDFEYNRLADVIKDWLPELEQL